ncbi:fungal-specific transcription factor domain-containing protein [Xylaria bambusicola]|uniref:fungal-specific transcription factor domain-containing protein n=1 Tax=Xylaria bambusicola TaxID=326684 RepID=UPI0020074276|nr:fungal-specific transcription factor domain-containing protein [Xylaria bambusicola]KAI0525711.1 fungal-specific transcription factor domain-containing protein [Xylaria bambusicola]
MASAMGKTPRILACVLCQNRKIKCDRHTPCSNCVKANVPCTPSTPAPPRKRRRPNQDLQQRLARCEELLSEYTTNPRTPSSNDFITRDDSWRPMGRLVIDDDGTKFTDSHLWATVHREISAMREILEDDELEDHCTPADARTPELHSSLILSEGTDGNVEDYRPSPAHAFRLWQTFLEKVNPLTKVIHVPSVQPKLVEATTDPSSIPKNVDALLFSIYAMGVVALNEKECQQQLGCGKEEAYQRFSTGCRIALMRIGILKTYDLVVLQALVLYFFSLSGRVDRHAAWILNGITVRVAQKMGLHRDGELLGLPPFETEMRRRVWWQIILIDTVYALMSGLGQSLIPRSWDTKQPNNINDADLYPTMTTLQPRSGPTDMIYCLVCYEMAKMLMDTPHLEAIILGNETGLPDKAPAEEVEKARRRIHELDQSISNILDNHCDPSMGPIHELAAETRHLLISKCQDLICPAKEQPEWGTEIHSSADNLFKICVAGLETDLRLYHKTRLQGQFLWFMLNQFQAEMLIYMAGQLCERTAGGLVERAWAAVEEHYRFHQELLTLSSKTHLALGILVIRAWKAREAFLQKATGSVPTTPNYIARLRAVLPSTEAKQLPVDDEVDGGSDVAASFNPLANRTAPTGLGMPWDQMLGFVDAGALDWDMFAGGGDNTSTAANAASGYGMGFIGHQGNSWM